MIDQEIIELINKEIDGIITVNERKYLHEYLRKNSEADEYYNNINKISKLLSEVKEVNPSPNLKTRIQNLIDPNLYRQSQKNNFKNWFYKIKIMSINPRIAFSFVSGLLIGIFLYATLFVNIMQSDNIDMQYLHGTIGANENYFKKVEVELNELSGAIFIYRNENIFSFHNNLKSGQELTISYLFTPSKISFLDFLPIDSSTYSISNQINMIQINSPNPKSFNLNFYLTVPDSSEIKLRLSQAGNLLFEKEVKLFL